ncbi:MAG: L-aspartate oxidase [Candidatus Lokiarchaeota archaeon]|nr:L-aspartate oxidase [Candidatus Lokiarchaeota archaeon]
MNEKVDFLIIGAGVAGLSAAIRLQNYGHVLMLAKNTVTDCNTDKAAGGVSCVWSDNDSFDKHVEDTLIAGDGLCNEEVVRSIVKEGPERIKDLIDWGIEFDKLPDGRYNLAKEGGHSKRRIFHVKDLTGHAVLEVLLSKAREFSNIIIREWNIAINLYGKDNKCLGVYVLDRKKNEIYTIYAKAIILATGGAGKTYLYTSNPDAASGDGIAMAYRMGAKIANMEFMQFHPTCLYHPYAKNALISESLRGEGGVLIDKRGRKFMMDYHELGDLAPRDIVSRAIDDVMKKTGDDNVLLDISFKDPAFLKKRFPGINNTCLKYGIDFTKEPIPVVPAAHYLCGGIVADIHGRTNIKDLYAIGECSCTGLHGANRLASNSLLEGLVCGTKCGIYVGEKYKNKENHAVKIPDWHEGCAVDPTEAVVINQNWDEIRRVMQNYVGIVRTDKRLKRAWHRLNLIDDEIEQYYWDFRITSDLIELRNLCMVARLMLKCARARRESRGIHFNLDCPNKSDLIRDTVVQYYW